MKKPVVPLVLLAAASGALIWSAGKDEQTIAHARPVAVPLTGEPSREGSLDSNGEGAQPQPVEETTWAHPDVMLELRAVEANPASYRAAIEKALPVLATDQDVQLKVGDMLTGQGDPVDGLAWQLLACMNCTQADERIGYGCAAEGLCDPNLALVDIFRRDFGEQMTADALARMEDIKTTIANKGSLAPFTQVLDTRFPGEGECVQLRTPTEECPPAEILRQTAPSAADRGNAESSSQ